MTSKNFKTNDLSPIKVFFNEKNGKELKTMYVVLCTISKLRNFKRVLKRNLVVIV